VLSLFVVLMLSFLLLLLASFRTCPEHIQKHLNRTFEQTESSANPNDNNHTSLGPHGISVMYGFVFASDRICSEEYLVFGSIVGTNISHGFGVYSQLFGVYPRVQQLSQALHQMSIHN